MNTLKTENAVQRMLVENGFTIAGGIWGDAAWKQIGPRLVVSIGQHHYGTPAAQRADYSAAPDNEGDRCAVYVYHGTPNEGWSISDGEAPVDEEFEFIPNLTLAEALWRIKSIEHAETVVADLAAAA